MKMKITWGRGTDLKNKKTSPSWPVLGWIVVPPSILLQGRHGQLLLPYLRPQKGCLGAFPWFGFKDDIFLVGIFFRLFSHFSPEGLVPTLPPLWLRTCSPRPGRGTGQPGDLEMRLSFFFKINIKLHTPNSNIKHLYEVVSAHKYEINIKLSVFKTVAMIKSLF